MNIVKGSNNLEIKMWTDGVPVESGAIDQLRNISQIPGIFKHIAAMPDVHVGKGATVGSVIATKGTIIPSAVSVDIGCGMAAVRLSLKSSQLPDNLYSIRREIELMVPVGFDEHNNDRLNVKEHRDTKKLINNHHRQLQTGYDAIVAKHPTIEKMARDVARKSWQQLGTLGGGNHFIEICEDENQDVWVMLHSGSRGIGNCIGRYFIELAKKDMGVHVANLPDKELAYLSEGTVHYDDYREAVAWAQGYARRNREVMLELVLAALTRHFPPFNITSEAVNCHHNYVEEEEHFGEFVNVTRKGAVSAQKDQLGIIPGSMGAKSFIVRGKGNEESFCSCSHGAGRVMSRSKAKRTITVEDHEESTKGIECRKDSGVIDESPKAYKDIDAVMLAQADLVEIVHTLRQLICVKG